MPSIQRRQLLLAVATRLATVSNATGYIGQVGAMYGLPGVTTPADPPAKSPTDPRVRPYFVLEPATGAPTDQTDLGDCLVDLDWPFTVRAAAGDASDLLALIDRIDGLLWRWSPGPVAGAQTGRVTRQPGYDPPLLIDDAQNPPRHYSPLQYRLTAHL